MQILTVNNVGKHGLRVKGEGDGKLSTIQNVSLYNEPPQEELTLDEFELFALDRLQMLRGIEMLSTRGFDGDVMKKKIESVSTNLFTLEKE
jgi:hypothetical protein